MKTQEYLNQGYDKMRYMNNIEQNNEQEYTYANTDQYIKDGIDVFEVKKQMVLREEAEIKKSDTRVYGHYDAHEKPTAEQIHDAAMETVTRKIQSNGIQKVFDAIETKGVNVDKDILMSVFVSAVTNGNLECASNVFKQQPKILEDLAVSEPIIDELLGKYSYESSIGNEFRTSTQEQKLECLDFCLGNSLYENHGRRAVMQMACEMGDQNLYAVGSKERPNLLFKDMEKNKLDLSKEGSAEIMKDLVNRGANPASFLGNLDNIFGVHQKNIEHILDFTGGNLSKEHAQKFLHHTLNNWAKSIENSHMEKSTYDFQKTALVCEKNDAKYDQYNFGGILNIFSEQNAKEARNFLTFLVNNGATVPADLSDVKSSWKKDIIDDCRALQQKKMLNTELKDVYQQKLFPRNPMKDIATGAHKKTTTQQEQERGHRRM